MTAGGGGEERPETLRELDPTRGATSLSSSLHPSVSVRDHLNCERVTATDLCSRVHSHG